MLKCKYERSGGDSMIGTAHSCAYGLSCGFTTDGEVIREIECQFDNFQQEELVTEFFTSHRR